MDYRLFIAQILHEAAKIASHNFGKTASVSTKTGDNNQVLTETDLAVGKLIIAKIQKTYPDHNIIDEEAGVIDKNSPHTWVVDPIDGTSNFANGLPTYGIMVGLLEKNEAIAGGIILPAFNKLYLAQKDHGAFCNEEKIHVSKENKLLSSLVAYGIDGHQENPEITFKETATLAKIILQIRNLRSSNSCFDLAQVAAGHYGAFLNQTSKIWDNVAPQIIIQEAGGLVTDYWGKPMDFSNPLTKAHDNFTICAGSPSLHEQLQTIVHSWQIQT